MFLGSPLRVKYSATPLRGHFGNWGGDRFCCKKPKRKKKSYEKIFEKKMCRYFFLQETDSETPPSTSRTLTPNRINVAREERKQNKYLFWKFSSFWEENQMSKIK